jgi:hypothetical protein
VNSREFSTFGWFDPALLPSILPRGSDHPAVYSATAAMVGDALGLMDDRATKVAGPAQPMVTRARPPPSPMGNDDTCFSTQAAAPSCGFGCFEWGSAVSNHAHVGRRKTPLIRAAIAWAR